MPRIHTITTDTVLSDNDMLLGTDGAVGANKATKNFSFGVFKNYITSNVTFTGDTIISGGSLTLDNNEFLMSKMANGTAASLIGISSNNQIKLSNSNLPIYTGTGLVSLGGNLELPNGNIIASGTLGASGYNDSNWNTAYSWGNHATAGYLPLTGGIITGNMTNRGEQSFGVDGDGENFKIYTNTSGKLLSFNPAANGKLNFTDNTMATFGNSDDLQIYHNGTANYIDSNGGQMFLRASVSDGKMYFMGDDGNGGHTEYFYLDGAAAVYNSNSGQAASVETRFPPDSKATFGITGAMQTSLWNSDAGNFFMSETGGGDMYFHSDGAKIVIGKRGSGATHSNPLIDAENMIVANTDGSVELYHDNSKKFQTTSAGVKTLGRIDINGAYVLPTTDGTNGQVLKTNGAGTLSFSNDLGALLGVQEGGEFTNSLIVGHSGTGTLDAALGNTGVGVGAMNAITQGDGNVAVGHDAAGGLTTGDFNVAIGKQALFSATTNNQNVAIGKDALYAANYDSAATDGNQNTAIGFSCGSGVTTGTGNVFIGFDTAKSITTGNDNIVIGSESNINTVKSGTIVIGHGIVDNYVENNSTYIGHTYTTKANVVGLRKNLSFTSSASQQVLLSQSGGIHRMNNATPSVTTLPNIAANAAVGMEIEFVIGTLPSGGVHKIVCHSTSSQEFVGSVNALDGTTLKGYSAQDSDNYSAISINGTTTGVVGTRIKLTCITSGKWLISGTIITNGTPVNPFTTT